MLHYSIAHTALKPLDKVQNKTLGKSAVAIKARHTSNKVSPKAVLCDIANSIYIAVSAGGQGTIAVTTRSRPARSR